MLKKLRTEQRELFLKQAYRDKDNLVFRNFRHDITNDNAVNKTLKQRLTTIGSKNIITFHGLRHTHASILISNGVDISYISERLGHKDITITLRVYSHLLKKHERNKTKKP